MRVWASRARALASNSIRSSKLKCALGVAAECARAVAEAHELQQLALLCAYYKRESLRYASSLRIKEIFELILERTVF
jgi:hypothetical protein